MDRLINNTRQTAQDSCSLPSNLYSTAGFTLVELMVSILLGLLVTAAAVSILITSTNSSSVQLASSSIQDNIVFSTSQIKKHIRRANRGAVGDGTNSGFIMGAKTAQGGVVLTAPNAPTNLDEKYAGKQYNPLAPITNLQGAKYGENKVPTTILTQSDHSVSNVKGDSGVLKNSQLTIQYQMPVEGNFDCQGRAIPENYFVIERYFVREDNGSKALVCASTNYKNEQVKTEGLDFLIDLSQYTNPDDDSENESNLDSETGGTVLIPNVDYFHVMIGVTDQKRFATSPDNMQIKYMNIPTANIITSEAFGKLRIVDIKLGMIIRSANPANSGVANTDQEFNVLNQTGIKLVDTSGAPYIRDVYETNILLRNARGKD